jgi:glyoxylase-like metal-dependent hydrolase (beta-lactamase superfamily II)
MNSLHLIDGLHLGRPHVICTALVESSGELALFDCGPESVFDETVRAIQRLGLAPSRVTRVFVSHIHFDHAGAAWRWAEEFGASIGVHPVGAPHLADPSRLVASATKIFGDQMERLWGRMRAVPPDKLRILQDGEEVKVGDLRVQALATPGHAPHHHAYWLPELGTVYAGDVAGVVINGGPCLPPCPPPDIDLAAWRNSLQRLRALQPRQLVLTHYGVVTDVAVRLDELEQRLERWAEWMRARLREGREPGELVPEFEKYVWDELRRAGLDDDAVATYEQADPAAMSVAGLARYWRKLRPEMLH